MNLFASDLISKSLLVVMSLAVILYSLFVGTFLGISATGFVLIVWGLFVYWSRAASQMRVLILSITTAALLIVLPVHLNLSSPQAFAESLLISVYAAANVEFSTPPSELSGFWWKDAIVKYAIALSICLCGAACVRRLSRPKLPA